MPVLAPRGAVATSQPLAAQAGLQVLRAGGNAVDAAIATAATLTVVEPNNNGIGSDLFALIWDGAKLHGLNASGRAPAAHTLELFAARGHERIPEAGWEAVTVPGAPGGWRDLHARFGKQPFASLFASAIDYAANGYPVSPMSAQLWAFAVPRYRALLPGAQSRGWFETFAPRGEAPAPGETWRSPGHARTLEAIAASNAGDFYEGALAAEIERFALATGGLLRREDLAAHVSTWDEPVSTSYRGHEVWEMPPNGQGITALIALNILEGFDLAAQPRESAQGYHWQIESLKLAFADALAFIADPAHAAVPVQELLSKEYAATRRAQIGAAALRPAPGRPAAGGTVYLCTADSDGMMVSLIQSNYMGFGSGIVVPGTGISLQNRGHGFSLDPAHPNHLAPGKRPYHTIIPSFLTRGGEPLGPFGVMGGYMQPQGHLQVVVNEVDYGMNPQAALDAPRWRWNEGRRVSLEQQTPPNLVHGLSARGHNVAIEPAGVAFGRGQVIRRLAGGGYVAGSDPRADGCAAGY
ncbi:MAG: gamma-glutamyltransferase family protein [Chloroflexi bacterium]|nr:gamma-glutamyltransferase family protein [Chloroflexota bacterium]